MSAKGQRCVKRLGQGWRIRGRRSGQSWARNYRSNAALQEEDLIEDISEEHSFEPRRPEPGPGPSTLAYIPHSSFASHAPRAARPVQPLYHRAAEHQAQDDVEISISREGTFKQRFQALKESTQALEGSLGRRRKVQVTERITERVPELTEESLRDFYGALLESGRDEGLDPLKLEAPKQEATQRLPYRRRKELLTGVAERLGVDGRMQWQLEDPVTSPSARSLASRLASRHTQGNEAALGRREVDAESGQVTQEGITKLEPHSLPSVEQISAVPARTRILARLAKMSSGAAGDVPLGLLSKSEWQAVIEDFIAHDNARGGEIAVALMQRHGSQPSDEHQLSYMALDAKRGRPNEIGRVIDAIETTGQFAPVAYHELFLRAHLSATPKNAQPAINHLRRLEMGGSPLPQSSYLIILDHLLKPSSTHSTNSHTHALAWDLFTHLRLVAHPTPSVDMYTTMINACASTTNPQPERARDLWLEMTTEGDCISPGREQYEAIIKALGSTKAGHLEAIGYLREMLAKHREVISLPFFGGENRSAALASRYIPTHSTFLAALEGIKRVGDVNRARWVLAEVLRLAKAQGEEGRGEAPDEKMMSSVFMTYAAWQPAISRDAVKLRGAPWAGPQADVSSPEEDVVEPHVPPRESLPPVAQVPEAESWASAEGSLNVSLPSESTPRGGPQARADALRETNLLLHRILEDRTPGALSLDVRPFQNVQVTPRLVNSFLSAQFSHSATLSDIRRIWDTTWAEVGKCSGAKPNGWSYLLALERCAMSKAQTRPAALAWATELWLRYRDYAEAAAASFANHGAQSDVSRASWLAGLGPRQTESIWAAIIRIHALCGDTQGSLHLLDDFRTSFPPSDILKRYEPTPPSSFSIRMTTASTVAEPDVPPHLLFPDVSIVHQRLVRDGDLANIGKVKWTCLSYEKALEKRRSWRLKGAGERRVRMEQTDNVATRQLLM